MPASRRAMRKIIEVLRLKFEARLSHERIAAATGVSKGAVTKYLQRARSAGLGWPLPPDLDQAQLEALLFPSAAALVERYSTPDFATIHQELKRKGVTLQLLWEEYATAHPGQAYRYSQFCLLYHRFAATLKHSMRQVHRAGEKLFVDYAGHKPKVVDRNTGEEREVELFVATFGASSFTYAEATETQRVADFIGSHSRALAYGGTHSLEGGRKLEILLDAQLLLVTELVTQVSDLRAPLRRIQARTLTLPINFGSDWFTQPRKGTQ